ncbi:MAG: dihydrodipicolinate synthase family protein [Deltaproteobacteria bacterium]|nr:dihydrodipicolinate synthase family protein [Deltaproteobacteria bacterium]
MTEMISLKGCFPPIPTPFDPNGRVDHDHLAANLEKWQKTPLRGFAVLGSNGESVLLKAEEKVAVWRTAGQMIAPDRLFIAGTGCESTSETLELTEKAAEAGADAAMIVTPHYYRPRMDHTALCAHYAFLADRSPIPIILYSVPGFTGVDLEPRTIIELAAHPNIIGLKESSGNVVKMGQVVHAAGDHFQVLAGSGSFLLPALSVGAVGGVMALAAVAPFQLQEIVDCFTKGDMERAREIQLGLIAANGAVTARFGISGLKMAVDFIGMYGGPVRSPLRPLDESQRSELEEILGEARIMSGELKDL